MLILNQDYYETEYLLYFNWILKFRKITMLKMKQSYGFCLYSMHYLGLFRLFINRLF